MPSLRNNMKKHWFWIIFASIVLVGAIVRLYGLDRYPVELLGDEVDVGYHAYSLATTGRDYTGQLLPTYIHSFSEWRAPLLMYATMPTIAIFGVNAWGLRLAPALFGIASIVLIYFLTLELTRNRKVGLAAMAVLALTPWHIAYSRTAYEVSLLLFLYILALWSFLKGLDKPKWFILSAVAFALTFYTYSTATVFTPLILIGLGVIYFKQLHRLPRKFVLIASLVFVVMCLPYGFNTLSGKTGERFARLSVLNTQEVANKIEDQRATPRFPSDNCPFCNQSFERLVHNKPAYLFTTISTSYLKAWSPEFLFLQLNPYPDQQKGGLGIFPISYLLFFLLGIYFVIKEYRQAGKVLLMWGLLAPVPAALTTDGANHATRLFLMILPIVIVTGVGLEAFIAWARRNAGNMIVGGLYLLFVIYTLFVAFHSYFVHMPVVGFQYWQYGISDSLGYVDQNKDKYQTIMVTNSGDPTTYRALFALKYPPSQFQKQFTSDKSQPNVIPGFDGFQVGNIIFAHKNDSNPGLAATLPPKTIYVVSQKYDVGTADWRQDPPQGITVLQTTVDPWGKPLYYVVTGP